MGAVVQFTGGRPSSRTTRSDPAVVLILPVVYVDRGIERRVMARYAKAKKLSRGDGAMLCANCALPIDGSTCSDCGHVHGGLVLKGR